MAAIALPRLIEEKFDDLAKQVRRLWLYRGLGRVIVIAIVAAVAGIALDRSVNLSSWARWAVTVGWVGLVAVSFWHFVLKPRRRALDATTLAAAIETQFPSLSERLMTLVELSQSRDPGHGSKTLIDLLVRDTSQRTRRLNFEKAAPRGPAVRIALLAGALIGLGFATILFASGGLNRVKRFLLPWHTPAIEMPFAINVSSGSVVVKRGEPVTLTAYLERRQPDAVLPETAVLVARDKATNTQKNLPMTLDGQAAFRITRPGVTADFDYRVEAGGAASDWFAVTVADPVELAEGTKVVVTPPAYAVPPLKATTLPGFASVNELQHAEIKFEFAFNRPATTASLDWQSNGAALLDSLRQTLTLSEDRRSAKATAPLTATGNYRLTLTGDHGVATSWSIPVTAVVDQPPKFDKVGGIGERVKAIKPDETVLLEVAVADDYRVESVHLEYAVNDGAPVEVPLTLKDIGSPKAEGKHVFSLAGKVKDGDKLKYRLKASDNRRLPAAGLLPQVTFFPEKNWVEVAVSLSAASLDQQEILAQRDEIRKKLDEAAAKANEARKEAEQLRRELGEQPMLTPEQLARRQAARDATKEAADRLDEGAKEAAMSPELRGLADAMRGTAEESLRGADEKLRRSENEPATASRNAAVADAEKQLAAARDRIEELKQRNEDLARNRLDRRRLSKLADEVNRLADAADKATEPKEREDLQKKLQQAKDELRDIVNNNEALRQGAESASTQQARDLAVEAERLKKKQAALAADIAKTEAEARRKVMGEPGANQAALNGKADELRNRTAGASKLAGEPPLAKEPFDAAGEKLKTGESTAAMTEQEKAARELERLAESLEKAASGRGDPREAAKQLAKAQEQLRERIAEAAKNPLTDEEKARFAAQQKAITEAAKKLTTPPGDKAAEKAKAETLERLKSAGEAAASDPANAGAAQQQAARALERLAEKLPSREERLKQARTDIEQLQREQESLQRDIEEKLKPFDRRKPDETTQKEIAKKLTDAERKQRELADRLGRIDAPGLEERRERTADSANRAGDDLRDGRPQDIPASQNDLRRRMAQLRTALEGGTPSDALADDLARKQKRIADEMQRNPDAASLGELQKQQREIADKLAGLQDPDAAERLMRSKQSTEAAARQFAKADDVEQLKKKSKEASKDLDELADQLAGAELDRERIERLAKSRRDEADRSKANASKPTPAEEAERLQGELERDLADLKQTRSGPAQEAKKAAVDQLERLRRTPNSERAPALQKAAADAIEELAKKMKETGKDGERTARQPNDGDATGDAGGQLPSKSDAEKARDLAREQRAVRDQTAKAAAEAKPDAAATTEQVKKQKELSEETGKLAKDLDAASQAPTAKGPDAKNLKEASEAANQAREQMKNAANEQQAGHSPSAEDARGEATHNLDRAREKANAAAGDAKSAPDPKAVEASRSAAEANGHLRDAGKSLGNEKSDAGKTIRKGAEKINEAADKLGEAGSKPGESGGNAEKSDGRDPNNKDNGTAKPLTEADLPPDLKQYAGKPWGELPGDVQARIIQDLKAKYGEDYARVIKLYFEQLAEKK